MIKLKEYFKIGGKFRLGMYITDYKKPILNCTYQVVSSGRSYEVMLSVCIVGSAKSCYTNIDGASDITEAQIEDLLKQFHGDVDMNKIWLLEPEDVVSFYENNKKAMEQIHEV